MPLTSSTGAAEAVPVKTSLTLALILAFLVVLPYLPGMRRFGVGQPMRHLVTLGRVPSLNADATVKPQPTRPPEPSRAKVAPSDWPDPVAPDCYGFKTSLRHFYEALGRTEAPNSSNVTRVLHYGDSPVTADLITADVRSLLQRRFGNAGHGFLLIAKPWAWYEHRGVSLKASGWTIEAATQQRARDGYHGLGGVSFRGDKGAKSRVTLSETQTAVEIDYLEQPDGGTFEVSVGSQILGTVQTAGPGKKLEFARFSLPPETKEVALDVTSGSVRAFGFVFERQGGGVIYSSLGLNGAQVQAVLRYFEPRQWAEAIRNQHPDLVIINYGTNESVYPQYIEKQYGGELRTVIERVRQAVPEASVLVMSPMDRGERTNGGEIESPPVLSRIVEIQKQTARETGCAFYDTFDAMGGAGTMGRWFNQQPRLVSGDFMHPLPGGASKVGALVADALTHGYDRYLAGQTHITSARTPGVVK